MQAIISKRKLLKKFENEITKICKCALFNSFMTEADII